MATSPWRPQPNAEARCDGTLLHSVNCQDTAHDPPSPGWLKIDPNFDPLRGKPRFQRLVAGGT